MLSYKLISEANSAKRLQNVRTENIKNEGKDHILN